MINVLDQNTIDQIAAGEVIERPASVVKELTENALDAGATAITVELKDGGFSLIRISDNGSGIEAEEIRTAFLRHATSKIRNASDLFGVRSLGFRGEALSSIASIAKVELLTKTSDSFLGTRYVIEGGEEKEMCETGCPNGTTFVVRDIFFNTPVRRKFLKAPGTEAGYVSEIIEKLALSHTDISFKFINNGKVLIHTSGKGKINNAFLELYGLDIAKALIPIDYTDEQNRIRLTGVIAKPYISRSSRDLEAFFINGRFVKSKVLMNGLEDAYKGYLMDRCRPIAALYLETAPGFVDVNVHPAKLEVRFENNELIYKTAFNAVRDALSGKNMIVSASVEKSKTISDFKSENRIALQKTHIPEPFENRETKTNSIEVEIEKKTSSYIGLSVMHEKETENDKTIVNTDTVEKYAEAFEHEKHEDAITEKVIITEEEPIKEKVIITEEQTIKEKEIDSTDKEPTISKALKEALELNISEASQEEIELDLYKDTGKEFRLIGQVFKTYWLIEMDNTFFVIDQHAAHEKVLFERTMKTLREKKTVLSQNLFPPAILTLSIRESEVLKANTEFFLQNGFEVEEFGNNEFRLSTVPYDLPDLNYQKLFEEILDTLLNERDTGHPDIILERIATISCKAAIKGNNEISFEEANQLIHDMLELEDPYHCPHGRPTTISMTKYDLDKKFKRIV